jgi:hypothetical protein
MAYSSEIARVLTEQLARLTTLNRHQLAGQVANLDFWLSEIRHHLEVISGYGARFERLKAAQKKHTIEHRVVEIPLGPADSWFGTPMAQLPKRVPDTELNDARTALTETTYRFLIRCWNEGLIEEPDVRKACDSLGIGVDSSDLRRR